MMNESQKDGRFSNLLVKIWQPLFFLAVLGLVLWRAPDLMIAPRFWAEEGIYYFAFAWNHSFWEALGFVHTRAGYFSLATNIPSAVAAHFFPLRSAPLVTTVFSLWTQMIPFAIIIWGRSHLWRTPNMKMVACLVLALAPSTHGEVWLNSLNLPTWCGLITFCILVEETKDRNRFEIGLYAVLLAFCCLSGPYSCFLAPLFALKWWFARTTGASLWGVTVGLTATVHLAIAISGVAHMNEKRKPLRDGDPVKIVSEIVGMHMATPLRNDRFGSDVASKLTTIGYQRGGQYWYPILALLFLVLLGIGLERENLLPITSFAFVSFLSTVLSFNMHPSGRYGVLAGFLFLVTLMAVVFRQGKSRFIQVRRLACMFLLCCALANGLVDYRKRPFLRYKTGSPVWGDEVRNWELDPQRGLRIWPHRPEKPWIIHIMPKGPSKNEAIVQKPPESTQSPDDSKDGDHSAVE